VKNTSSSIGTGRIIISTNDKEVGRIIDIHDPNLPVLATVKHEGTSIRHDLFLSEGEKIFRNVNPIYNQKECFSCHKPEEKITGVLVTDFTLNNVEKQLQAELRETSFSCSLPSVSRPWPSHRLNQLVIKKLQHFVEAASLFTRGDFKRTISFKSDDEIKRLADSFNLMAKTLWRR